jgi:hypothetical protein
VGDPVESAAVALERSIRAEMESMEAATKELAARARRLGVGARAINGLQAATAVWSRDYEAIVAKISEEGPEVTQALLGKPPVPMTEIVPSEAAVDAIREARKRPA